MAAVGTVKPFLHLSLLCLFACLIPAAVFAAPRSPYPPLPELGLALWHESFDAVYYAGVSNTEVVIPNYGTVRESWTGYSLERSGLVPPLIISGLGEMGRVQVATDKGALRFWFRPYWTSGGGPGEAVRLAELVAVEGSQSAVLWSLQVSADGAGLRLVGPEGKEVLLAAEIDWPAGSWHQVVLNYGTNGTELVLDGELVTKGDGTLAMPASVVRLVVGSSLSGDLSAGGEIEEVCCFARPLKAAFHWLPLRDIAAMGPVSEEEMAYRQELREKWKELKAAKAKESEESGGGEMMRLVGGPAANCVTNGPVFLTNVVVTLSTNDGWTIYFDIMGGETNPVPFDIFSTPELLGNDVTNSVWTWLETGLPCETHYYTNQPTNQVFYILTIPGADRDGDGLYDGWEWKHFGTLAQPPNSDYDGDGVSNLAAYTNESNPNKILFAVNFGSTYVNGNSATGSVTVLQGVPEWVAVLVNSTNFEAATWQPFASNAVVNLGTTDGVFLVWVGLRGHAWDAGVNWHGIEITRDTLAPVIAITSPTNAVVLRSRIQLQGYISEPLSSLVYNLTNAAGLITNQAGYVTGVHPDTNTWKFTTNYFQCYDLLLTNGANLITLQAIDRAGNIATSNLSLTLDNSSNTNPPAVTILWPPNNSVVAGTNFTLRGQVDDDTATVAVNWLGTNTLVALVERGGRFSIPGISLPGATNVVTLTATNSLGYGSSLQRTVIKSAAIVTMNPLSPDQVAQAFVTVTGSVSDTNLDVWVNGVQATVSADGTWEVSNVPLQANAGSASFGISVYPSGSDPDITPPSAIESPTVTLPPRVSVAGHIERYYVAWDEIRELRERNWEAGVGGKSRVSFSSPSASMELQVDWPAEWPDGQTLVGQLSGVGSVGETPLLPWQYWEEAGAAPHVTARRSVRTPVVLTAGGPARSGTEQLIRLVVSAATYSTDVTYYLTPGLINPGGDFAWQYDGDVPLPVSAIRVDGQLVTTTATNAGVGQIFVAQAAGTTRALQITVTTNRYSVTAIPEEVKVELKSVTFSTNLSYLLIRDSGFSDPYSIPHWTHTNSSPVAFASGTRMEAQIGVSVANISTNTSLVFKGETGRGITFWGTNSVSGMNLSVTVIADHSLATNKVDFFDPLTIQWSVAISGGASFVNIGKSTNQLYVTLRVPQLVTPEFKHTVLHLACANPGATNDDQAIANTWSLFAGPPNVKTWNNLPLTYYGTSDGGLNTTMFKLLENRDAQCRGFSELLEAAYRANGITNVQHIKVWPPIGGGHDMIAIKNIAFTNTTYPSEQDYKYSDSDLDDSPSGIPGQNTNPPKAKQFAEHRILRCGALYYDPSYGVIITNEVDCTSRVDAWRRPDFRWRKAFGATNLLEFVPLN